METISKQNTCFYLPKLTIAFKNDFKKFKASFNRKLFNIVMFRKFQGRST